MNTPLQAGTLRDTRPPLAVQQQPVWAFPEELKALESMPEMIAELLRLYLSDTDSRMSAIRQALSGGDVIEMGRQAHAVKGASAQMGAESFALGCKALEAAAKGSQGDYATLVDQIVNEFARVRPAIEAYLVERSS